MKNIVYKVFTAFSGYDSQMMALGLLSTLYSWLKFELVGWSEIEPSAIVSHNAAFPEYADCNYGDIGKIDWSMVPDFKVFTYSFPCQSVSRSGKSEGIRKGSGAASSLLWECERAIIAKRPKFCVMENVKALITNQKTAGADSTMCEDFMMWEQTMCRLGYKNFLKVIDAADFGVPQHRERTIMVSVRIDEDDLDPQYEFPPTKNLKPKAIDSVLEDTVDENNYLSDDDVKSCIATLASSRKNVPCVEMPIVDEDTIKHSLPVKKIITPTTKNGVATTLMASSSNKSNTFKYFLSTGSHPKTGVIEVWECNESLAHANIDCVVLSSEYKTKMKRGIYNQSRDEILTTVTNLKENQFIRLRGLTATECLSLMSVPSIYINRMLNPMIELQKLGYSEDEILSMMTLPIECKKTGIIKNKFIKTNDNALRKMAGNSIVVDVLYHVFKSLFH